MVVGTCFVNAHRLTASLYAVFWVIHGGLKDECIWRIDDTVKCIGTLDNGLVRFGSVRPVGWILRNPNEMVGDNQ